MPLNIRPTWRNEAFELEDSQSVFCSVIYQLLVFFVSYTGVFPLNCIWSEIKGTPKLHQPSPTPL